MAPRELVAVLCSVAIGAVAAGCRSAAGAGETVRAPGEGAPVGPKTARVAYLSPSIVLPDLPPGVAGAGLEPDGSRRVLLLQMRLLEHADGSLERSPTLLPTGSARLLSAELPSRLGGGYLFVAASDSSAQLWRAASWLAPLEPVATVSTQIQQIVPGFDRLYFRGSRPGPYSAFDLDKAEWTGFGELPMPMRLGPGAFADAWRAVVVGDVRGPMATFDGGRSWHPLGVGAPVTGVQLAGERILVTTREQQWALGADGSLTTLGPPAPKPSEAEPAAGPPQAGPERPLGRRPLRLALERGVPVAIDSILVAHGGNLAFVETGKGAVTRLVRDVYPSSYSDCQGIALGDGVGFVCGAARGPTTVYAYVPPSKLAAVMHWPEPRAVFPNGNGAVAVRAPCPGAAAAPGLSQYCVRDLDGRVREIRFKGDVGAERVVPLADGRVAVIIAPRPGADARLVMLAQGKLTAKALDYGALPRGAIEVLRRGLWMNGAFEVAPGVVGLWVEAGGPLVGIRIDTDGRVSAGAVQRPPGDIVVSGRFGIVWKSTGRGLDTVDGGKTWRELDAPPGALRVGSERRGCSPAGCAVGGWLRVGWGPARERDDLAAAKRPPSKNPPSRGLRPVTFSCELTGRGAAPPPQVKPEPAAAARVAMGVPTSAWGRAPSAGGHRVVPQPGLRGAARGWTPFGNTPAPPLGADQDGVGSGRDYFGGRENGDAKYRVYAWGPRASEWSRAGHWQVRFEDPFDPAGTVRSTLVSLPPFADLSAATMALSSSIDFVTDSSGRAGVLAWCSMPRQCKHFGVVAGETPVPFTTAEPAGMPNVSSVVRTDDGWYVLGRTIGAESDLWSVTPSGQARRVRSFPRVTPEYDDSALRLVRRASGHGIGLWSVTPLFGRNASEWVLMPLDRATGQVLEVLRLGPNDLDGVAPGACAPGQDGWLFESGFPLAPDLWLGDRERFGGMVRARYRADPGRVCVDGLFVRARFRDLHATAPARGDKQPGTPLALWDYDEDRKRELVCVPGRR